MRLLLIFFLFIFSFKAYSQKEYNNWYFGNKAGVSFNTTPITILKNSAMRAWEGCATISDKNGYLLFYTNGESVWNKNHSIMDNGSGLKGDTNSTQSALIIPLPGSTTIYYLFTTDAYAGPNGLQYSIIDMASNNGLGKVTQKNILLYAPVTEKLTAALHKNGKDVWIVAHDWGNNNFLAYLLTSSGINTTPVISSVGSIHGKNAANDSDATGYMKFSHNYRMLAVALEQQLKVELFDFNAGLGKVTNARTFPLNAYENPPHVYFNPYGLEFSSDNSNLYVGVRRQSQICMFDVSRCSTKDIIKSVQFFGGSVGDFTNGLSDLQLGPDKKIYFGGYDPRHKDDYDWQILWIPYPNKKDEDSIYRVPPLENRYRNLRPGTFFYGIPNIFYGNYFKPDFTVKIKCKDSVVQFLSDPTQDYSVQYQWDFGDTTSGAANYSNLRNPRHIYTQAGKYLVQEVRINGCIIDTIQKEIEVFPVLAPPLGKDTVLCQSNALVLDAKNPGAKFSWSTGDTTSKITVNKTGKYWVKISNSQCAITDTIQVRFSTLSADSIYGSRSVCPNYGVIDYIVQKDSGAAYQWEVTGGTIISGQGTDSVNIFWNGSGSGSLAVVESTLYGCVGDTIKTEIFIDNALQTPVPQGKTDVCAYEGNITYSTVRKNGSVYNWKIEGGVIVSGNGTHQVLVNWLGAGKGRLAVKETGGIVPCEGDTVSLEVNIHAKPQKPEINGKDVVCRTEPTIYYTQSHPESIYEWHIKGGAILGIKGQDTVLVQWLAAGTQQLSVKEITKYGCESDSAISKIKVLESPQANAGEDITICSGQAIQIGKNIPENGVQYNWFSAKEINDTNIANPVFKAYNYTDSVQQYSLVLSATLSATGCKNHDTVIVSVNPQPAVIPYDTVYICSDEIATLDAGNNGSVYKWSSGSREKTIQIKEQGWYSVEIQNQYCTTTDSVYVKVHALPLVDIGADTMYLCLDVAAKKPILLDAGAQTNYLWWPGNETSRYLEIADTGFYKVKVTNVSGCAVYDSIRILPRCPTIVFVPNAFSPNNDSHNDIFKVSGNDFIDFQLDIYNRWGERVFSTKNPDKGWDGNFKGSASPMDVYLWTLSYKGYSETGKTVKYISGTIQLLR